MRKAPTYTILLLLLLIACKKTPEGILSKDDMEDVLFDYHLMQGMIDQMDSEQRRQNQRYLEAVFRKHGITEAQFDTSMVWYNREGTMLKAIYADLNKRYKDYEAELKLKSGSENLLTTLSQTGDTANIWSGQQLMVLRARHGLNREVFSLNADTTFRRKDKFALYATAYFVREIRDDRNCSLIVGLTAAYKSGKTTGAIRTVDFTGPVELSLETAADEELTDLHGFFYYQGSPSMRNIALINKIALVRMHDKTQPPPPPVADTLKTDSLATDSARADTAVAKPHRHLTPEEVRRLNRTEDRIQIRAVPEVRTRNSYGPRRKKTRRQNRP